MNCPGGCGATSRREEKGPLAGFALARPDAPSRSSCASPACSCSCVSVFAHAGISARESARHRVCRAYTQINRAIGRAYKFLVGPISLLRELRRTGGTGERRGEQGGERRQQQQQQQLLRRGHLSVRVGFHYVRYCSVCLLLGRRCVFSGGAQGKLIGQLGNYITGREGCEAGRGRFMPALASIFEFLD